MARGGIFSEANNKYLADFNQRSRPKSPLMTPVEKRRKNRGSGLGYIAASAASGLAGVFEGAADLVVGTAALFSGDKAYAQHVFEDSKVGEWKRNIDTSYNPGPIMNFTGQVAQGIGQSSTFLIPHVGAGLFFTGVIGGSTGEAVQKTGNLGLREYAYGTLSGATEGALEMLTGAGGQLARKLYGKTATTAGKAVFSKVTQWASAAAWRGVAKDMVSSAAGEFVEEFLGDYTDVFWSRVTGVDPEASTTLASAMYSGLIGAVSGGLMGGVGSAISVGQHYASGRRVIENGNVDATINTARRVAAAFDTKTGSGMAPALTDLKSSLKAYEGLTDKTGTEAAIQLGNIKADLFYTQSFDGVQKVYSQLESVSPEALDTYAAYMSSQTGKKYSAADFAANKDGIKMAYAIEAWSALFLSDSQAQSDMAGFRTIIDADKAATAAQAAPVVRNISEAVNDSGEGWDGSDAVFKTQSDIRQIDRDYRRVVENDITAEGGTTVTAEGADAPAPESEIGYIRVKKLGDDAYSISWGADAENMRGFKSRTEAEVRRLLGQISKADSELVQSYKAFKAAEADTSAGESIPSDEIKKTYEKVIPFIEAMDSASASGAELNTGEVTYSAAEQDTARKAVKGFDTLDPDTRRAVLDWIRSAEGQDPKMIRAISSIIAARPGLHVLFAELGEGHKGLYTDKLGEGRRLVVVDAEQAGDAVMQTITHELTHDLESTDGYSKLKKAALRGTSEARRLEIIDMYVKKFGAEQTYSEFLGDRTGTAETWDEYLKQYPQIDGEAISAEIVAKAVGEKLGKVGFIDKYSSTNILSAGWNWLKRLYKSLRADRADELALGTTVKLGRAFEKALGQARSAKNGTGMSAYDIAESREDKEYRKPITQSDIQKIRDIAAAHGGDRVSINDFTSEDIKATQKWAYKFYQELGTKSPFFRAWFGDWRAHDRSKINTVTVNNIDLENVVMQNGDYSNADTGWSIQAGRTLRSETKHYARGEKVSIKALNDIQSIIKNAVLLDTEISNFDSNKKSPNTAFMHKLYTSIIYKGQPYIAKISVEEFYDEGTEAVKRKGYHLAAIKIEAAGGRYIDFSTISPRSDTASMDSISDLYALVKRFDKDFHSGKEVNPVLLNEDGTPKVFYHGTKSEWTQYDLTKNVNQMYGDGIYLTPDPERARLYGDIIMPFYVKADTDYRKAKLTGKTRDYTLIKKTGDILVYSPTQIKSATGNIGTFDRSNPDIRYDLEESGEDNEKYSYKSLTQKDDIAIKVLSDACPTENEKIDRAEVISRARSNVMAHENPNNTKKESFIYVADIDKQVRVSRDSLEHGLTRGDEATAIATMSIGDLMQNSIAVNELNGRTTNKKSTDMSYVLLAVGKNKSGEYLVRMIVDKNSNSLSAVSSYGLYAAKAKKEGALFMPKGNERVGVNAPVSYLRSTISIADLLDNVKQLNLANEILSDDVAKNLGVVRSKGTLSGSLRYDLAKNEADYTGNGKKSYSNSKKYSYDSLTAKKELPVVNITAEIPVTSNGATDYKAIIAIGKKNARKENNLHNTKTSTYVYVPDIKRDVLIGANGLKHGLPRSRETALAVMNIGDILRNSFAVNELNASTSRATDMSYVLLGAFRDSKNIYAVRTVVSKQTNNVTEFDIYQLGAVKGKKIETPDPALKRGAAVTEQSSLISSESPTVSISNFLQAVKNISLINEVFSNDVAAKLNVTRSNGDMSRDTRYDLAENEDANAVSESENKKAEKKARDKAKAEEQKKAREKEETRQLFRMAVEDHSTKSKRAFFSVDAANAAVEGLIKKAPLIAQIPEAADIIHRAFNLYEGDRAVEEAADSLKIAFTKKLFDSRKRQKTKDSTLKDYNAKEGEISSYLKWAYKTHTTSRDVIYTAADAQRMLRNALKNTLLIVPTNDGGISVEGDAVRVDSNTMRRVARRLSELFSERRYTDAELDALSNKVVDYMLNSLVITNKELLDSVAADTIGSTELISFFDQHMGRIKEDADISRRIEVLKRSNSSHSRSLYERWVGKDSDATVTVGELMNSLREQFGISVEYTTANTFDLLENLDEAYRREQAALRTTLTRTLVEKYGLDPAEIKNEIKSFYKDKGRLTNRDQAISNLERRLAEKNSIYEARLEAVKQAARDKLAEERQRVNDVKQAARDKLDEERQQYRGEKSAMKAVSRIISYARKIKDRMEGYNHTGVLAGPEFESLMKSASRVVSGNSFSPRGAVQFANDVLAFLRVASPEMMAMMEYIDKNSDVFAGLEEKYQQALEQGDTVSGFFADLVEPLLEIAELGSKDFSLENASMQVERSLTVNEMQTIAEAMQAVLRLEARHGRVFINGEWVDSMSYSDSLMESSANRYNRVKDKIDKFFTSSMIIETIQPNLFAQIMEGTYGDGRSVLSALFGEIGKAAAKKDDDMLKLTADIRKFIDEGVEEGGRRLGGKEYKKHYEKDVIALTLKNPGQKEQRLSLTVGEAISFVATFKRAQARPTFALNAFEFKDVEGRGAGFLNRVAERIAVDQDVEPGTPEFDLIMDRLMNQIGKSVAEVEAQLTDGDRKLMQLGEAFFEKSKQIKMATDLILFGKTNIIAGYYFPILRSKLGRDMDYIGRGGLEYSESLRNFRWNKRTLRQANGRIVIDDYLSVINNHADQLTSYSNYSIPLQNLQRIVNGKTSITVKDCKTAREFISRYVYKEFDNYLKKYVTDVQGRRPIGTELTRKVERFLGRSVSNVLGLNISSMLKQLESAMLAMGYVSAPSWFGGFRPLNADKMTTYSTAARIRLNDSVLLSSHTGLRAVDRMDKIAGIGMITLRKGDALVTQMLWSMCQFEVENKLGLQVGTEENYIKAGEKLDWLISMVQDTSDEASKSSLSRSDNRLMQMTTLFRNQPMKIWSQIVGCAWELSNLQSIRKSGGKVSESESSRAKSRVCRLSAGLVASSVFGAAVSLMLSALRGNRDEDEPIAKTLASDTLGNILGIVPLAGQLAETLLSGYDAENFYYGVINDGLDTIESSYKLISDAASGNRVTTQQASSSIRKALIFAGQMTGVPVRNAENIVKSLTHVFIPSAFYKYKSMFYSPTTADVKKAIGSGNTRMAETAMRQLMLYSKTGSRSNARVNGEMTRLYAAGYTNAVPRSTPVRTTVDGEGKSLTAKQTKQFEQIYHQADNAAAQLVSTADYAALTDEQKAKALRGIYDIYYSRAAHAVLGADLATASALSYLTDDVPELVTAAAYMSGLKTDSDGKRADKVRMYVSGYPTELQPVLLWAGGQRSASVKSRLSKLAEGLQDPERTAVTSALKIDT